MNAAMANLFFHDTHEAEVLDVKTYVLYLYLLTFSSSVAENVLMKTLKLEDATLTVQPNLRCSSRHQSTQREVGGTHEHDQQIHDHDSDGFMRERRLVHV